ncbi:MAG: PIG-L deacetylase family protein [Chloroflexota bacterium]
MTELRSIDAVGDPVLVVCAHPDDVEIHAGGLVALLAAAGRSVELVLVTSGDRGTADPSCSRERITTIREEEQRRAAAELGAPEPIFLRFPDGDVRYEARDLRERLTRLIREKRPRTIVTHEPFGRAENADACSVYPDHRAVGEAVFEAAYLGAPGPLYHPEHIHEGLGAHRPDRILCVMSDRPNVFFDIAPVFERKWSAIRQHRSQGRDAHGMEDFFRDIARQQGRLARGGLAEGYWELLPG